MASMNSEIMAKIKADMRKNALSEDELRNLVGRSAADIFVPADWTFIGNRGPGFDTMASPDHKTKMMLFSTAKDGVIAAGDGWDKVVYADGWDKASVIRAMCDNLTRWLDNILPDDAKGGD